MDDRGPIGPPRARKTFVLCFDGTGNKFSGDETDSNILKIYRMLDRADGMTFTFYQPGIGTYVDTGHFQTSGTISKIKSWYMKSKDAAIGSSFADHVMGGYKFLMRYYSSEDDLYFFGFSRGAYTARFLAEMLDHVGLLSAGNEELTKFAWKTYAKWAGRTTGDSTSGKEKEADLYSFMRGFRETFSRRVRRIRFLGLFDTVNSVSAFEGAWMQRTKFPYTAKSSAKVIRHAVSIDERRAKFRQDLIAGSKHPDHQGIHRYNTDLPALFKQQHLDAEFGNGSTLGSAVPSINVTEPDLADNPMAKDLDVGEEAQPPEAPMITTSTQDLPENQITAQGPSHPKIPRKWSDATKTQDIQEVWFPGCHGDIGGGWKRSPGEHRMISHVPLAWMVHEAEKAGLKFDPIKMAALNCCPDAIDKYGTRQTHASALEYYHGEFHTAGNTGKIHDALVYGDGLAWGGVAAWKFMEYLPFQRMDLRPDGTWKPIRWPLPCGETRDIPDDAQIHVSAINRMKHDPKYRPGNLIVGGGGRGTRTASEKYGMGHWEVHQNEGDRILETFVRRDPPEQK